MVSSDSDSWNEQDVHTYMESDEFKEFKEVNSEFELAVEQLGTMAKYWLAFIAFVILATLAGAGYLAYLVVVSLI